MNNSQDKVTLALFAHEIVPEIGHSRAMIETINQLPADKIEKLYIISFEMTSASKIFPKLASKVEFIKVPKLYFGPFLVKMLYFFIASWLVAKTRIPAKAKKIGIGIASLTVDYVNIQFIHREWEYFYFKNFSFPIHKYIYKKLLFFFFKLGENYLYRFKDSTKFSVLSKFETSYLESTFKVPKHNLKLNYSGINLDNFKFSNSSKDKIFMDLKEKYPQLEKIDIERPIYLFVGAFERKGLHLVIEKIQEVPNAQLLVVGSPEAGGNFHFPSSLNITHIKFTKEIQSFYQISDCFIFPTIYEPFGLVLAEAACMGLKIYTTSYKVGASELLDNLDQVHIFDDPNDIVIEPLEEPLPYEEKLKLREQRLERLQSMTWKKTGESFWEVLSLP